MRAITKAASMTMLLGLNATDGGMTLGNMPFLEGSEHALPVCFSIASAACIRFAKKAFVYLDCGFRRLRLSASLGLFLGLVRMLT